MRALGVDVGLRKGLDLVLLDEQRRVVDLAGHLSHDRFREVVEQWAPDAIAIDSPPAWAQAGIRETEQALRRLGIQLYVTPAADRRSQKGFHDWMIAGMNAFTSISDIYPLFRGGSPAGTAMEVFPHAAAVVLEGGLMPEGLRKADWRRAALAGVGVTDSRLRSPDLVDAGLAALVALMALEGCACWFGLPMEGVIVLPCEAASLPERFRRLSPPPAHPREQVIRRK